MAGLRRGLAGGDGVASRDEASLRRSVPAPAAGSGCCSGSGSDSGPGVTNFFSDKPAAAVAAAAAVPGAEDAAAVGVAPPCRLGLGGAFHETRRVLRSTQ